MKNWIRYFFAFLLIFAIGTLCVRADTGDHDWSFGTAGTAQYSDTFQDEKLVRQQDGKLLVIGTRYDGGPTELIVKRFKTDGSIDYAYGASGEAYRAVSPTPPNFPYVNGIARASRIQFDGKLVVAGYISTYYPLTQQTINEATVWRFTTTGILDTSFAGDGELRVAGGDWVNDMIVTASGKIIVNYHLPGRAGGNYIRRYNLDGTSDATFGTGAKITLGNISWLIMGIAATSDDFYLEWQDGSGHRGIRHYTADGTLDNTFGTAGFAVIGGCTNAPNNTVMWIRGIEVQADGKPIIFTEGLHGPTLLPHSSVARFLTSGLPDPAFAAGTGVVCLANDRIASVKVQADTRILVLTNYRQADLKKNLTRYYSNGQIDFTFGQSSWTGYGLDMSIQPNDGRIVTLESGAMQRYLP